MARIIQIDEDTSIGYSYPNKVYYVINKGTMTTRTGVEQAKRVLDIVAPLHQVTLEQLQALKDTLEPLVSLSYTLEDTGKHVKTIQINSYTENPLTLDLDKHILYIMNSNIIFDLTLNESSNSRIERIIDYYNRHLGIDLSFATVTKLYDYLLSFQETKPYIQVSHLDKNKPITYTYQIPLANPSNVDYTLLLNPNFTYTYPTIAYINEINSNRVLTLNQAVPSTLHIGDTIQIANATTVLTDETSYSSNGTYTISNIQDNYILVRESIPTYKTPRIKCYLKQPVLSITKADRNLKQFTLTSPVPNSIVIGDTIHVEGTTKVIDYQTTTIDNTYTVYAINNNLLTVYEDVPTDYVQEGTETPILTKHVPLGEIVSIKNKVITLSNNNVPIGLTNLAITIEGKDYTISKQTTNTITVKEHIDEYEPNFAELQVAVPTQEVKATIKKSDLEELPIGEFILDNPTSCISYLKLGLADESVPTLDSFAKLGQAIEDTIRIDTDEVEDMHLIGLYKEVYEDKTK